MRQYTELYAQAAITLVRQKQDAQARTLLQSFVQIAGSPEIGEHIKAYEDSIPTSGDELSEDEIRANKDLLKRLEQLRRGLK